MTHCSDCFISFWCTTTPLILVCLQGECSPLSVDSQDSQLRFTVYTRICDTCTRRGSRSNSSEVGGLPHLSLSLSLPPPPSLSLFLLITIQLLGGTMLGSLPDGWLHTLCATLNLERSGSWAWLAPSRALLCLSMGLTVCVCVCVCVGVCVCVSGCVP